MNGRLLAVPNISEGRDAEKVRRLAAPATGALLLDVHSDPHHNRSVLTLAARIDRLPAACEGLVRKAIEELDLQAHEGVHPRFGTVDVLPFVVYQAPETDVRRAADEAGERIGRLGVPVHRYGIRGPSLPDLRRALRSDDPPLPQHGPPEPHPRAGRVCIGVRGPLLAFNVNLRGDLGRGREVARAIRDPSIQALAFPTGDRVQLSMNLIDPLRVGPKQAFDRIAALASEHGLETLDAEVVGLLPDELERDAEALPLRDPARTVAEATRAATRGPGS